MPLFGFRRAYEEVKKEEAAALRKEGAERYKAAAADKLQKDNGSDSDALPVLPSVEIADYR